MVGPGTLNLLLFPQAFFATPMPPKKNVLQWQLELVHRVQAVAAQDGPSRAAIHAEYATNEWTTSKLEKFVEHYNARRRFPSVDAPLEGLLFGF